MHETPIKLLIVEDSAEQKAILQAHLAAVPNLVIAGAVTSGEAYIEAMSRDRSINAVLLDEQLEGDLGGMEAYMILQLRGRQAATILMTGSVPPASHAADLGIVDTLEKPYLAERLDKAVRKLRRHLNYERFVAGGGFYVPVVSDRIIQLTPADILFVESLSRTVYVHTEEDQYETKIALRLYEDYLLYHDFALTHRSFLVNLSQIGGIDGNVIRFRHSVKTALISEDKVNDFTKRWSIHKSRQIGRL